MRSNVICKLQICANHFNLVLFHGNAINRHTCLASTLYLSGHPFSSKGSFPKDRFIDKLIDSVKEKSYRTDRDTYRIKDEQNNEGRNWKNTDEKRPSFQSMFAAGTAKRAAERKRIAALEKKDGQNNEGRNGRNTDEKRPSFRSMFAAGTAKRTAERYRIAALESGMEQTRLHDTKRKRDEERINLPVKIPERPLSVAEWRELMEPMGNKQGFEIHLMNLMIKSGADLNIAKSLLTFVVTETGTLSYELLLRYLSFCVLGGHDSEVFDVYDIMRATFPSLEKQACRLFMKSFCRTERWREALVILEDFKMFLSPTPSIYGEVIAAAVKRHDLSTAWRLHDKIIANGRSPGAEIWEVLFTGALGTENRDRGEKMMSQYEYEERLLGVLHHMRDNQIYPQINLAGTIKTWFESLEDQKWKGSWTSVTPNGTCRCCGSELESIQLTAEEYQQLKNQVMVNVIHGPDVFKKTTPEELESFKAFVKRRTAFDVVVDGLNVAKVNKDRYKSAETLLTVVSKFTRQGLAVLVLGREHMLRNTKYWNRSLMNLLQQRAHCFFTENISEDDPFLLYAALNSGNHCRIVSRDLMRDHKACMPDRQLRQLFFKWQRGHQLVYTYCPEEKKVCFLDIPSYDTIVQTSAGSWHIPYDDTEDRSTYEVPDKWLCLTKRH